MFSLANPWLLFLWPLPLLMYFLPPVRRALPAALKVPFFNHFQNALGANTPLRTGASPLCLWALVWGLLIFAAAGPRWVGEPRPIQRDGRNIMLALDLSGSMEIDDMLVNGRPVSRLAVVKYAAEQFVKERTGDRIGLILFGTRAYLQTPLTYDRATVLHRLEDVSIGLAGKRTAIGDAIGLAVKRLQNVPKQGRVLILLTDGASNAGLLDPINATKMAKNDDIKIYTIGLGSVGRPQFGGMFIGPNPSADLDEKTLREIAKMTGGRYFRATDPASLHKIYQRINQIETVQQEQAMLRPQVDYYPWFAAVALLIAGGWLMMSSGVSPLQGRSNRSERVVHE